MIDVMFEWDSKKKRYNPYCKPWYNGCKVYAELNESVLCARCGKKMTAGNGYSSKFIHNRCGMAYIICEECYKNEIEE